MRLYPALLAVLIISTSAHAAVTLVRDHKPLAAIHVSAKATAPEQFAASEIQSYLQKITGAALPIKATQPAGNAPAIIIALDQSLGLEALSRRTDGNHLLILGGGPRGIVYSAYDFLESLGCRWYWPGELGEVLPSLATLTVPDTARTFTPSFARRHAMGSAGDGWKDVQWNKDVVDWLVKNHQNFWLQSPKDDPGFLARRGGTYTKIGSGHNWQHIIPPATYFKDHPEYFALIKGKRVANGQLCLTNPTVQKLLMDYALAGAAQMAQNPDIMFVDMTQNDGDDWCQCESCKALDDRDPSTHADILFWALNPIADAVAKVQPKALLHTYVYAGADGPPSWIKPAANIHCEQTNYCYNYGASFMNPGSGPALKFKEKLDAWTSLATVRGIYEYYGFYNWLEAMPVSLYRLHDETNYYKQIGVHGLYSETQQRWSTNHLLYYAFSRVWWDHTTDVPAMLDEYFRLFFGPAEKPMRSFYLALETSGGPNRYLSGNEFDLYNLYPKALRDQCRAYLSEAKTLAGGDPKITARLAFIQLGWDYTEKHLAAMEAHAAFRKSATPEARAAARKAWQDYVACFDQYTGTHAFDDNDLQSFKQRAQKQLDAYEFSLATLPPGDATYQDQFNAGGNARLHATVTGFYDGIWGLCTHPHGTGTITYELGAQPGHTWQDLQVAWYASYREGLTSVIEFSLDGQTWQPLAENKKLAWDDEFNLTDLVRGKSKCYVRARVTSALDQDVAAVHGFRLKGRIE
ncbi:MAG: DUF4838 domain-containing protein [Armatimonadia bacterium]